MQESVDENPYTVEPGQAACPLRFHHLRFDHMPREVQSMVLKHTHARFVVTYRTETSPTWLAYNPQNSNPQATNRTWLLFWEFRLGFVPLVKRYEFNLQRRLAGREPEMTARFSQWLHPALKQTTLWQTCPRAFQIGIEQAAAQMVEIETFSQLKFDELRPGNGLKGLFCFLRENGAQSLAPQWSQFWINSEVLDEVRDKMQSVFNQPFSHV